jgi:hypothetical protein
MENLCHSVLTEEMMHAKIQSDIKKRMKEIQ